MSEIVVQTQNPRDLKPSELESLIADLSKAFPDLNVRITSKETRRRVHGVTLYEVITIWIPTTVVYAQVLKYCVKWARSRHRINHSRPKSITIYGADGKPLTSVVVRADTEEVEEKLPSHRRILPPPPGNPETSLQDKKSFNPPSAH